MKEDRIDSLVTLLRRNVNAAASWDEIVECNFLYNLLRETFIFDDMYESEMKNIKKVIDIKMTPW